MIVFTVLYPNTEGSSFNMDYYMSKHHSLLKKVWGSYLKGVSIDKGIGGAEPGAKPEYLVITRLFFESLEDVQAALANASSLFEDIPNFTNIEAMVQISENLITE